MAIVKAFKGIRPQPNLADKVASPPFDVLSSDEAREMAKGNKYSFFRVTKSEIELDANVDLYSDVVYEKARENFLGLIQDNVLIQESKPVYYIYSITMNNRSQTGIVACVSVDEYNDGKIKKHELTRKDKEADRMRHVDTCNANTGPIFLAYRNKEEINKIVKEWKDEHKPVYDFTSSDGICHRAWIVDCETEINRLFQLFADVPALYIADGHHRTASAAGVAMKRRKAGACPEAESNFFLAILFPDNELEILDYNRVVYDLNGYGENEFIEKLKEKFEVEELTGLNEYKPQSIHTFGMYLNGKWYKLAYNQHLPENTGVVDALDVSILQNEVLAPILNILDPRSDNRIDFVGGSRGVGELKKRVDSGEMAVAFSMYPTSMDELLSVADAGEIMPPKSTWFEPKPRSGLFVHSLAD